MKKFAIAAVAALVSVSAFAGAEWVGDSLIQFNGIWYNASGNEDWATGGAFGGNLGEFAITETFTVGGQLKVYAPDAANWNNGGSFADGMRYKIDNGSWVDVELNNTHHWSGNNMVFEPGAWNDQSAEEDKWEYAAATISGLTAGEHTISIYFGGEQGIDGNWDGKDTPYSATFTVKSAAVPEPATMSLLGLGALAMVIRRKLSK